MKHKYITLSFYKQNRNMEVFHKKHIFWTNLKLILFEIYLDFTQGFSGCCTACSVSAVQENEYWIQRVVQGEHPPREFICPLPTKASRFYAFLMVKSTISFLELNSKRPPPTLKPQKNVWIRHCQLIVSEDCSEICLNGLIWNQWKKSTLIHTHLYIYIQS